MYQPNMNEYNEERINVIFSDDGMTGYVKLVKAEPKAVSDEAEGAGDGDGGDAEKEIPPPEPVSAGEIFEALGKKGIVFGIKEESVRKLADRPIYGIKIEVAKGVDSIDGQDGYIDFYVKRDAVYKPDYNQEGVIDYKNLAYFQQVNKGHLLCDIVRATEGTEGTNIFGGVIPAKNGKEPISPVGKNTVLSEDGRKLTAGVSGVVRFVRDVVDINEVLQIKEDVNQSTGNINFPGDVVIGGDVYHGFSVKSGGNVTIKGMIAGAAVEAAGDIIVGKGINGASLEKIKAGGNLRSGYIENADIEIQGDITSDYIIDSNIYCGHNIELVGRNELVVGGNILLRGELTAKTIGNDNERPTRIELLGETEEGDIESINKLEAEKAEHLESAGKLSATLKQYSRFGELYDERPGPEVIALLVQQLELLKSRIDEITAEIKTIRDELSVTYPGSVICKRKLYQGVKIHFGNEVFRFSLDDLERCRIYCREGEIMQGTL
ncbi:hypothetical protein MASR2M70_19240 [Bacillota bacterium]